MIQNNIRKIRLARGMTLAQLALRLNMTQPSLTRMENGSQPISLERVAEIASALGCAPTDILPDAWGASGFDPVRFLRILNAVNRALKTHRRTMVEAKKIKLVLRLYANGCGMDDDVAANDNEIADQIPDIQNMVA